jgi:FkbM family methyltransferase
MAFIIKYGSASFNLDVTEIVLSKLNKNGICTIPSNDHNRSAIFTDPLYGTLKSIFVINTEENICTVYDATKTVYIDLEKKISYTTENENADTIQRKLLDIQKQMHIDYGSFKDEFPEQMMAVKYLTGQEKVLEIGGNIGRNSLVIGYILNNCENTDFVSLECDLQIAKQLTHNRDINGLKFQIESSALSKRKLIQKGWDTIVSHVVLPGYTAVNTLTYAELCQKYNIQFDTLVLDCEGAFYYILLDMPEILDNIKLIIMENDYHEIERKLTVDDILRKNNFYVDHSESGGWGCCQVNFFEVWKRV